MNITCARPRSCVDDNGQVRCVDQRRSVPIDARRHAQGTARKLSHPLRTVDLPSEAARMIELIRDLVDAGVKFKIEDHVGVLDVKLCS